MWKRKRKSQHSNCCSGGPSGPAERENRQHDGDLGGGETRLISVLLVLRALRMRHTATDPRPPPPPWTGNPQTLAQLSTHTIGLRRWILARTATTTSAWTPSPRNPTLTRRGRQRWQQRRCLPSGPGALLHLCYCCLASGPDPPSPPHGTAWVLAALKSCLENGKKSGGSGACVCSRHPTCSLCVTIVPSVFIRAKRVSICYMREKKN